jgi:hypothetical protein
MLSGVRVVLVEDEPLVAQTIEAMIVEVEGEVASSPTVSMMRDSS